MRSPAGLWPGGLVLARSQHPPIRAGLTRRSAPALRTGGEQFRLRMTQILCYTAGTHRNTPLISQRVAPGRAAMSESSNRVRRPAASVAQRRGAVPGGAGRAGRPEPARHQRPGAGLRQAPRLETVRLLADGLALADDERAALLAAARLLCSARVPPPAVDLLARLVAACR